MITILNILILVAMLGFIIFVIWHTAYRLHIHFQSIPLRAFRISVVAVAIVSIVAAMAMMRVSYPFVSIINRIGGYVLLFFFMQQTLKFLLFEILYKISVIFF